MRTRKWWMWDGIFRRKNSMAILMSKRGVMVALVALGLQATGQDLSSRLSVSSIPDKATVTCDGVAREETPLTINGLRSGPHLILVEKPGFLPARRTVTLEAGQRSSVDIPLERMTGLVLVKTVPAGADIEINGAHRGVAPLLITDLVFGRYRLKASAAGYLGRNVEVAVEDRIPKAVFISLASDSAILTVQSAVSVISTPTGARLFVDDALRGQTPLTLDNLEAGSHVLRVENDGYESEIRAVEINKAQKKVEEFQLVRNVGSLEVMAKPNGIKVVVDGVEKGVVMPEADDPVGKLSLELPVGEHRVSLLFKGYGAVEKRVTIRKGETLVLKEVLKRVFMADTRVRMTTGEIVMGVLGETLPNGDVKLETQIGIYKTLEAAKIAKIEPLPLPAK